MRNVDPKSRLATVAETGTQSQRDLSYDFLVAATGLRRVWPVVPQATTRESYLAEADAHITELRNAREGVVIIGGGKSPKCEAVTAATDAVQVRLG